MRPTRPPPRARRPARGRAARRAGHHVARRPHRPHLRSRLEAGSRRAAGERRTRRLDPRHRPARPRLRRPRQRDRARRAAPRRTPRARRGPNWPLLARLGAAAAVQVTPTPAGFHVAVYNVATKQTALVKDFPSTAAPDSRAWRAALHRIADELEEAFTGIRGIARTRVLFERGRRIWVVDSDGEGAMPLSDAGTPMSPAWHPNGRMIAYATYEPARHLGARSASGRARTWWQRRRGVHLAHLHAGRRERRLRARRGRRASICTPRSLSRRRRTPALGRSRQRQRVAELQPRWAAHRVHVGTRRPSRDLHHGRRRHERRSAHAARLRRERLSREPRLVARRPARRVPVA